MVGSWENWRSNFDRIVAFRYVKYDGMLGSEGNNIFESGRYNLVGCPPTIMGIQQLLSQRGALRRRSLIYQVSEDLCHSILRLITAWVRIFTWPVDALSGSRWQWRWRSRY